MRTESAKEGSFEQSWHIVDVDNKVLGRAASRVARILMGKEKPIYTPHVDTGDYVVVINAGKIRLTGRKVENNVKYYHTGWPGGLREVRTGDLLKKQPEELFRRAVMGMLPKTKLGKQMLTKLKVHRDELPGHGYRAQNARKLEL